MRRGCSGYWGLLVGALVVACGAGGLPFPAQGEERKGGAHDPWAALYGVPAGSKHESHVLMWSACSLALFVGQIPSSNLPHLVARQVSKGRCSEGDAHLGGADRCEGGDLGCSYQLEEAGLTAKRRVAAVMDPMARLVAAYNAAQGGWVRGRVCVHRCGWKDPPGAKSRFDSSRSARFHAWVKDLEQRVRTHGGRPKALGPASAGVQPQYLAMCRSNRTCARPTDTLLYDPPPTGDGGPEGASAGERWAVSVADVTDEAQVAVCGVYAMDYACLGLKLPAACTKGPGSMKGRKCLDLGGGAWKWPRPGTLGGAVILTPPPPEAKSKSKPVRQPRGSAGGGGAGRRGGPRGGQTRGVPAAPESGKETLERGVGGGGGGGEGEGGTCLGRKRAERADTERAQAQLHATQHPPSCASASFLLCQSGLAHDGDAAQHGIGARMYYYSRCVTKALMFNRTALLDEENPGTSEILGNFQPWSGCTLGDVEAARARPGGVVDYDPSYDGHGTDAMLRPATALVPREWRHKSPLWWKAQELHYALRPEASTEAAVRERMGAVGWPEGESTPGMHVRRTDKVHGCSGSGKKKQCIKESDFHPLYRYVLRLKDVYKDLRRVNPSHPMGTRVFLSTDDSAMGSERDETEKEHRVHFLKNPVAPDRTIGRYSGKETRAAAVDLLLMARSDPFVFAYSSHYGAMAFLLKLVRDDFCSNFASVDLGFRFWPSAGHFAGGGLCRVTFAKKNPMGLDLREGEGHPEGTHCTVFVEDGRFVRSACAC